MAALAIQSTNDLQVPLPAIAVLADGASVLVRPALPSDSAQLQRLFHRLSPTTIYRWCFLPVLNDAHWMQTIANVRAIDYQNEYAMVASYAGEIIGIARYDRSANSQVAEYGIVIEDAWQARGVGKLLMGHLILEASRHGITDFAATILGENRPALRLAASLFEKPTIQWQQGECLLSGRLDSFKPPYNVACMISKHPARSFR